MNAQAGQVVEAEVVTANPFVGPMPIREGQPIYGRSREIRELAELLVSERVVVLMSQSGAGKTSLIHAGLLPLLRSRARNRFRPLPTVRLAHASAAGEGNIYVDTVLRQLEAERPVEEQWPAERLARHSLTSYVVERYEAEKDLLLLVLDQFEELFTLHRSDTDAKHAFIRQLSDLLAGVDEEDDHDGEDGAEGGRAGASVPVVWTLISMREDFLAELEPLRAHMPTGLAFRYRLLPLDRDAAAQAICGPAAGRITQAAAYWLADDLRAMGAGGTADAPDTARRLGRYVEPMLLQVSCLRLWDKVVLGESRAVEVGDIGGGGEHSGKSGQVDAALGSFYAAAVETSAKTSGASQRALRDFVESQLITPSGLRARPRRDPYLSPSTNTAIDLLEGRHLLRIETDEGGQIVELVHDRLIAPIRADNAAWRNGNLSVIQKAAALWAGADRPREMLLYGDNLDRGIAQAEAPAGPDGLSITERAFVKASIDERNRLRRDRLMRRALIGVCFVLTVLCLAIAWFYREVQMVRLNHIGAELRSYGRVEANDELLDVARKDASDLVDGTMIEVLGGQAPALSTLARHGGIVRAVAFTPDGRQVLSAGWDRTLRVASFPDRAGEPGATANPSGINAMAVQPGGNIVVLGDNDGTVSFWRREGNAATLLHRSKIAGRAVTAVAFNDDGSLLAMATADKRLLLQPVAPDGTPGQEEVVDARTVHHSSIYRIAFVPGTSGKLISGDWNGHLVLWSRDATKGETDMERKLEVAPGESEATRSMAVSPDGRWLAVGDDHGVLRLWDLADASQMEGRKPGKVTDHQSWVNAVAFSPDGKILVSAGQDEALKRYDFNPAAATVEDAVVSATEVGGWGEKLYSIAFDPANAKRLAVGGSRYVRAVDIDGVNALTTRFDTSGTKPPRDVASSGEWVVALRQDGSAVDVWRRRNGALLAQPALPLASPASRIAFDGKGARLAILGESHDRVDILAWPGGTLTATAPATRSTSCASSGSGTPASLAFSREGDYLATLDYGAVTIRSTKDWKSISTPLCGVRAIAVGEKQLAYTRTLANSEAVGLVPLDNPVRNVEWTFSSDAPVNALVFSPGGEWLIAGTNDGRVWGWARKGEGYNGNAYEISSLHHNGISQLAYLPDPAGKSHSRYLLLAADTDGVLGVCRGNFAGGRSEASRPQCGKVMDLPAGVRRLSAVDDQVIVVTDHLYTMNLDHRTMFDRADRLSWCKGMNHGVCSEDDSQ
ncbi:hypothetical protein BJI69_05590 [Luteibacter rhizovicinus DSM 16549]|uniref:Uncharacterized protein n=1 Tax=Luteibacter rhizovicinus DSM 16549 TaxID=1440763 RepID=A0A0G9HK46_9GAMM|nr:hypothetical protein [Luteibacter rhizovicinus]APG03441.1 hypothetical protein BJI69_05590 [Luteibacter rhizovicinus DSM 16549]KLD68077.1 hypothetical protein Y883_04245 [Luteibacter rhizovicinus DSM 16549]KLD77242.1 hypothetical protein Y886_16950 [Xanthomonas hyacinthi DSM 19077]